VYSSEIIAGGEPGDFALIRHVRLGGSQRDIGHDIAELAWANHHVRPQPGPDPALTRARRAWRAIHWPELEERAAGVAGRWELMPSDDRYDIGSLFVSGMAGGCSAVWLPPERTTTGTPMLTRNFDFPPWTLRQFLGAPTQPGDEPFCARPYVLETRPSSGHATITVTAFDLLSGAVDGINDAGLVAALLSDDESTTGGPAGGGGEPTLAPAVGLHEVEVCRYVLERCADVDEAVEALRLAKHYYFFHPQHYLIADRTGRCFAYEMSPGRNLERVTWGTGLQVLTNHLLMRYPTVGDLPASDGGGGRTFARFRALTAMFSDQPRYAPEEVTSRHATIRFAGPDIPIRTLWHVLYEPAATAMTVSFHVRDDESGEVRSPQMRFSLAPGRIC
jgi:hypothetical protein